MNKGIPVIDIYNAKNEAESQIADILKAFTIMSGMNVDGIEIINIPTHENNINLYYKPRLIVKL
jgi:hypothetical protein